MHIRELFPDVISEDLDYEYKTVLNPDKPIKWAKTIVGYANGKGGVMFVGVSNEGEAFGISLDGDGIYQFPCFVPLVWNLYVHKAP